MTEAVQPPPVVIADEALEAGAKDSIGSVENVRNARASLGSLPKGYPPPP